MKKLLFVLFLFNTCIYAYSQENTDKPVSEKELKTIKDVVEDAREGVVFVDNNELIKRIKDNQKLILLDVRSKEEYDAGHLKGATWMERGVVEFTMARTVRDADAEIIVYCMKSNRSALVVKALKQMGYKNVKSHIGMDGWIKDGNSIYNYLGEIKVVKQREVNAATNPIDYYLDKKID